MTNRKKIIPLLVLLVAFIGAGGWYVWHDVLHDAEAEKKLAGKEQSEQYTCPMHPFIVKDRPGTCPICNMALVKKVAAGSDPGVERAIGQVMLSPTQQLIANVATVEARVEPLAREVAAVGIVTYDQSRQGKVTAWVAGRLDRLYVNKVGDYVTQGKPVASVYSPDLVAAQQEYLLALRSRDQFKGSAFPSIAASGEGLVASARERLKLLGVTEAQIARLEKAGSGETRLNIYTPLSGVVIEKMMVEGQYVNVGDVLFSVADLSTVWVELEVYENDFPAVKPGQKVEIVSQSYPGTTFTGTVTFIYPFLDPKTRTVKVRVSIPNRGMKLKPDMYVNATVKAPLGNAIAVPAAAVMDTGKRKVVWVEKSAGVFEPRDVQTGARSGDKVQILSGLNAGDKVAASGGYLIDSESQLTAPAGGGEHSQHTGGKQKDTPGKGDLDMSDMKM